MVSEFMVELYAPGEGDEEWVRSLTPARPGACGSVEEDLVHYVGSLVIPGDETCFHIFDGPSLDVVREAMERASIRFERIVPVVQVEPEGQIGEFHERASSSLRERPRGVSRRLRKVQR